MGKEGMIGLEEFDFWLKPWKKQKNTEEENINSGPTSQRKNNGSRSERKLSQVGQAQEAENGL